MPDEPLLDVGQAAGVEHARQPRAALGAAQAAHIGAELDELPHPHVGVEDGVLRQVSDAGAGAQRIAADVDPVHADAPCHGK
jgi:hypothetical protein